MTSPSAFYPPRSVCLLFPVLEVRGTAACRSLDNRHLLKLAASLLESANKIPDIHERQTSGVSAPNLLVGNLRSTSLSNRDPALRFGSDVIYLASMETNKMTNDC